MNNFPQQPEHIISNTNVDVTSLALRGIQTFAKRHKVFTGSYLLGLGVMLLLCVAPGTKLTDTQKQTYNRIMSSIDMEGEYAASSRYAMALANYRATKGWFFTCDGTCQRNKVRMENAFQDLEEIRKEGHQRMSDARSVAGLFSELGVEEVQDSFWSYFNAGKQFAKRQSMWDAMFMGIRRMGRDESLIEYALKVLLQVLINFSMGLIIALFVFLFGLWSIIKSYQPNPLTAVVFFVAAACAGFAFVTTYLFLMYGAAGGAVYGAAKLAESQLRLQQQQQQQGGQQQRVQHQQRAHYH